MSNTAIDRAEYCELKSWRSLQDSLLQQIISRKRDVSKKKLRGQMGMFSIPEYLKKINEIDAEHEKRLKQNKEWQVLQKNNFAVNRNIGNGIKNRIRKNISNEKNKFITGVEKANEYVSKTSGKKIATKFKKIKTNSKSQQLIKIGTPSKNISYSRSSNCFLITKLSSSSTLIKKIPTPELSLSKSQLSFPTLRALPASIHPRIQTEISSKTSPLSLDRLNICPEITPGTTQTITDSFSLSLPKIPQTHRRLSINSQKSLRPIRQYHSSKKHSRKFVESISSKWSIESITLSGNSHATSTEKNEFCSSEIMMCETFSSLLTKLSFHREWTEPEIYYTPKFAASSLSFGEL